MKGKKYHFLFESSMIEMGARVLIELRERERERIEGFI